MLNPELKLNSDFLNKSLMKATRDGFGEGLFLLGNENKNVVVLTADLKESMRVEKFAHSFPERFFDVGVAEQNLVGVAAGLGISGKIPFITSYAVFSPGRNWEQIRTTVCYQDANVKIGGGHAGLMVGPDGATHQALEDIALMRVLPNMKVFSPCDFFEAQKITQIMGNIWGPMYIRLSREKSAMITTPETPLSSGGVSTFWISQYPQCTLFVTGPIVEEALIAAQMLEMENIHVLVSNISIIKPLDEKSIISLLRKTRAAVTIEDHQIMGGLGGVIAEVTSRNFPIPIEYIGVNNSFGESGSSEELLKKNGISAKHICVAVKKVISRKK